MSRSPTRRRNVTITLDEDVARWARIKAAESDTSVARLVGDMLRERMHQDAGYDAAMRQLFELVRPLPRAWVGGKRPTRADLHDRRKLQS